MDANSLNQQVFKCIFNLGPPLLIRYRPRATFIHHCNQLTCNYGRVLHAQRHLADVSLREGLRSHRNKAGGLVHLASDRAVAHVVQAESAIARVRKDDRT